VGEEPWRRIAKWNPPNSVGKKMGRGEIGLRVYNRGETLFTVYCMQQWNCHNETHLYY
jgi:hypothetical protein